MARKGNGAETSRKVGRLKMSREYIEVQRNTHIQGNHPDIYEPYILNGKTDVPAPAERGTITATDGTGGTNSTDKYQNDSRFKVVKSNMSENTQASTQGSHGMVYKTELGTVTIENMPIGRMGLRRTECMAAMTMCLIVIMAFLLMKYHFIVRRCSEKK